MSSTLFAKASETGLFLKRVLSNPRQLGAVMPSSPRIGALMAQHTHWQKGEPVVELGAGTGAMTKALLDAGIPPEQLYAVELDDAFIPHLRQKFPNVHIVHGSASALHTLLPQDVQGQVKTIISGLPMINFPESLRQAIVESTFSIMAPEGELLQFTYSPKASLNAALYGLHKKKIGQVLRNIPPATIWRYTQNSTGINITL